MFSAVSFRCNVSLAYRGRSAVSSSRSSAGLKAVKGQIGSCSLRSASRQNSRLFSTSTGQQNTTKVLILYHSLWGHIHQLAKAMAEGAKSVPDVEVTLRRVPETLPDSVLEKMHALETKKKLDAEVPVLEDVNELANYDAVFFGTGTRYGNMTAQLKSFFDRCGALWVKGTMEGRVGTVFTSSGSQHGGQESTILSTHIVLLHFGMVVVGLPYSSPSTQGVDEVKGCGPYGASTLSGPDGSRQPSHSDLNGARDQGKHAATITRALVLGKLAAAQKK